METGIYKNKWFSQWAKKHGVSDADLCETIQRMESGFVDANLGGGVMKQRVARPNQGKSGGFRTIIFFRAGERAFFIFGFAKNQQGNISASDLQAFKSSAQVTLNFTPEEIQEAIDTGKLIKVNCDEEDL